MGGWCGMRYGKPVGAADIIRCIASTLGGEDVGGALGAKGKLAMQAAAVAGAVAGTSAGCKVAMAEMVEAAKVQAPPPAPPAAAAPPLVEVAG